MCGSCDSILCPAVPEIDWSAFTWRWQSPDSPAEWVYDGQIDGAAREIARKIFATDREMIHPGQCNCLWIVPVSDRGRATDEDGSYPVPCLGALQRNGQQWILSIVRWYPINWEFYNGFWNWDDTYLNGACNAWNGGAAGWTPYGWNGWGWGYGWAYGWGTYAGAYSTRAVYRFNGVKLATDGTANTFNLQQLVAGGDQSADTGSNTYWPAFVNLSTIPKDGRQT